MSMRSALRLATALAGTLVLWAIPTVAAGNSTPAWTMPGSGGLVVPVTTTSVRIERERLHFDFVSSLASPKIRADYDLVNLTASPVTLDLLFVGPTASAPALALDGVALRAVPAERAQLPAEWLAPSSGIDPTTGEEYPLRDYGGGTGRTSAYSFSLGLPADGRSRLTAEYESLAGYDRTRTDHVVRHLAYILGPAGNWAGFGRLEVTATAPSRYVLAARPALLKQGEAGGVSTYSASFDGIPAEVMRISIVASPGPVSGWIGWIGFGLPFLPGLILASIGGRLFSRMRHRIVAFFVAGAVVYFVSAVAGTALSWAVMAQEPFASATEDRSDLATMTYTQIFAAIGLAPFAASVIAAVWAAAASRPTASRGG